MSPKPTVGRVVWFLAANDDIRAATIVNVVDVDKDIIDCQVWRKTGDGAILFRDVKKGHDVGDWQWPKKS